MILLIDNYDSFTFNLKQYLDALGSECVVYRNDAIDLVGIEKLAPSKIVISPGPGDPNSAGITLALIQKYSGQIPILGVCLGHQAIGQAFGGKVIRAPRPLHGKTSTIKHNGTGLFYGMENPFHAARYHSLIVERQSLPECLEICAETDDGLIMALRHKAFSVYGLQFHPESIATEQGSKLLKNFLEVS